MADRDAFLKLARARWQQAETTDTTQRQRELDDLKFYAGEQWSDAIKTAREGSEASNGMPPVPARPCLVINKVREPVNQVLNQERQADLGIELIPADDFEQVSGPIDDTEIELREGLIRRIQRQSHAADARTWAFSRAVIAGRGYYGVMTRYVPGKTFDQEIYLQRFYNQASVLLDPSHEQPDGSDAQWGFVGVDMPYDEYRAMFSRKGQNGHELNPVITATDGEWRALGDEAPKWFTTTGDTKSVRVVDYYYITRTTVTLYKLADGSAVEERELPDPSLLAPEDAGPNKRDYTIQQVKWAKLDGHQVLDETDWPGQYIPIVKVTGVELQPYDAERRVEGMVRPARDSQVSFNAMVSKEVETIALTPIPPLSVEEGTIEGYEAWYAASATRTLPYLPYKRSNLAGQEAVPPQVLNRQSQIGDIVVAVREFDQAIKSTTAVPDPTLGNIDPSLKSGKAIKFLLEQAQRGNSHFLDNLVRSMNYEAQIVNDLLYPIYGQRPGRLARLMTGQGETQPVVIGQPFIMAGKEGQQRPTVTDPNAPNAKTYTLTKDASFNIAIKVSKSFDTRREQEAAIVGDLIAAEPQLMTWFGDLFFKYQDGPGHKEMAERAKLMLAPPIQAKLQEQTPIPPELQAQIGQMQQAVSELTRALETKQVEADAQLKKAEMDNATKLEIAKIQAGSQLAVADLKAQIDAAQLAAEQLRTIVEAAEEQRLAGQDHAHEAGMSQMEHEQAKELASHTVAITPEPEPAVAE